jgi:hypothetical protein
MAPITEARLAYNPIASHRLWFSFNACSDLSGRGHQSLCREPAASLA